MYRHILCMYEIVEIVSGKESIKIIRLGIFRPQYFKGQFKNMTSNVMNGGLNVAQSTHSPWAWVDLVVAHCLLDEYQPLHIPSASPSHLEA